MASTQVAHPTRLETRTKEFDARASRRLYRKPEARVKADRARLLAPNPDGAIPAAFVGGAQRRPVSSGRRRVVRGPAARAGRRSPSASDETRKMVNYA